MKKRITKEQTKKILIYVGIFLLGFIIAPSGETKVVEKEVVKEVAVANEADWKRLKEIDDEGFSYCADFVESTSNTWTALVDGKFNVIGGYTDDVVFIGEQMSELANKRKEILVKLGY